MLECSLGKINGAVVRRAFSAYTFVELTVPIELYSDSPTFTLVVNGVRTEYTTVGSEVYMRPGEKTVVRVSGMEASQMSWLETHPMSADSAEVSELLKGLGIGNGPRIPITFLNLFLNRGQLAVVLANMSPKTAFVDFGGKRVVYYSDLYKKKPLQLNVTFRRMYGRVPIAGYVGWGSDTKGYYPDDTQSVLSFGHFDNLDESVMKNLVTNCNDIAKLFSDMQIFTWPTELPLGSTVISPLTYDKKVVVAVEEQWDAQDNVIAAYYCV